MSGQSKKAFGILFLLIWGGEASLLGGQDYDLERRRMVAFQLAGRDITDARVLGAMGRVPRHLFVNPVFRDRAYDDHPLPIEEGQTISQPYIVAFMTQSLSLRAGEKVLEIGTGSGYQAAVLACLTDRVYSIEIHCALAEKADRLLRRLGYEVRVRCGDGYHGWPEEAPFDAMMITSAAKLVPEPLLDQLRDGGRLVMPLEGAFGRQVLVLVTKTRGRPVVRRLLDVRFVPMTGEVESRNKRKK
ncbi:MAG: protein-L-isoaspartate(D-aspartate) O-methyltransferase [Candidatus Aminicenantes bacterium]|nr:protein-L-isoaspartate(D-aspartate) O-methyltransferase [Candidatus Aminicenantes bacterium]